MVKTFNVGNTVLVLASLDTDWTYATDFPQHAHGVRIHSIQYIPSGINDKCMLRDITGLVASGPELFYAASPNNFAIKFLGGKQYKLAYDVSDSNNTCAASGNAKIIIVTGGYLD
jgi:hypothetical protein